MNDKKDNKNSNKKKIYIYKEIKNLYIFLIKSNKKYLINFIYLTIR